ncbi:hypothetical protein RclHR1_00280009 [Rhizophagus clarus]|uniref:Uncharacterized protein n=1 Tax=Rhizophagus clarus TaxID=94130 RepID=A0A2Z6R2K3_9GLOM|nr:hypothetical protein RclHR1_00280009 [Rhizophagus clarus]
MWHFVIPNGVYSKKRNGIDSVRQLCDQGDPNVIKTGSAFSLTLLNTLKKRTNLVPEIILLDRTKNTMDN